MTDTKGINPERLISSAKHFNCEICQHISKNPKECLQCGVLFCDLCIKQYILKNKKCINGCIPQKLNDLSKSLSKIYNQLELKCIHFQKCKKILKMYDINNHQLNCQSIKCKNSNICQNIVNKIKNYDNIFCSKECYIFNLIKEAKDDFSIYNQLKQCIQESKIIQLNWNTKHCFSGMVIKGNKATLNNGLTYTFVSVVADKPFMSGKHYWQIKLTPETINQSKCGVTTTLQINYQKAFSDYTTGFAFYGLGQLRNGSDSTGPFYGKNWNKSQTLGIFLDMDKGTLSFMIGGKNYGTAYQDNRLKKGPIYAAVSILRTGGCIINNKPIPSVYL